MDNLFAILILTSIVCLPISLYKPSIFHIIQLGKPTRNKAALTFGGILVISLIFFGLTYHSNPTLKSSVTVVNPNDSLSQKVDKPSSVETETSKRITNPNPSPSDWISNPECPLSVPDFDACLRDKYPLKAKVRADSLALYITNTQNVVWTNCNVSLADGSFGMNLFDKFTIGAGTTTSVSWGRLVNDNGDRFDYFKKQPGAVDIICVVNHEQHNSQYSGY